MKPLRYKLNKFYKVLNVNNDSSIAMCVVLDSLLMDYMAKGGLAAIEDYIEDQA